MSDDLKPDNCVCECECTPQIEGGEPGGYWVVCRDPDCCWIGPTCPTPTEAVAAWNYVMGIVAK